MPKDVRLNSTPFFIMKIPNKRELWQIALNHSLDIDFKDFIKISKESTAEPYSLLINDTTLSLNNPVKLRKVVLKQIYNKIITIDDQIKGEKLQYDINRGVSKASDYHQAKLISMNTLQVNKYYFLIRHN